MDVGKSPGAPVTISSPGVGLEGHIHADPVAPRAGVAEARHADEDEGRVQGLEVRVAQPQPFHYPGAEVFDQYVRFGCQARGQLPPSGGLQIEGDGPLVPVDVEEEGGPVLAAVRREIDLGGAQAVRPRGRLHLENLGPQVGQQPGAEGAGQHVAEVEDPDAVQGRRFLRGRDGSRGALFVLHGEPFPFGSVERPVAPGAHRRLAPAIALAGPWAG